MNYREEYKKARAKLEILEGIGVIMIYVAIFVVAMMR